MQKVKSELCNTLACDCFECPTFSKIVLLFREEVYRQDHRDRFPYRPSISSRCPHRPKIIILHGTCPAMVGAGQTLQDEVRPPRISLRLHRGSASVRLCPTKSVSGFGRRVWFYYKCKNKLLQQ